MKHCANSNWCVVCPHSSKNLNVALEMQLDRGTVDALHACIYREDERSKKNTDNDAKTLLDQSCGQNSKPKNTEITCFYCKQRGQKVPSVVSFRDVSANMRDAIITIAMGILTPLYPVRRVNVAPPGWWTQG